MQPQKNDTFIKQLIKNDAKLFSFLKLGDLVEGTVLEKSSGRLFLDFSRYGTGIVRGFEFSKAKEIIKGLKVGDKIHAKIVEIDNKDGYIEASLTEADRQKAWTEVVELQGREEILKIVPNAFNRGGLMANIRGLSAFLPVSHLASEHYPRVGDEDKTKIAEALQGLVGQELSVRIINVNPRANKLIISEKEASQLSASELSKNYEVGQEVKVIISGTADFGVFVKFVDNPAVEGLIHISELDHRMINNPKEVVQVDNVVKVKIVEIKDGKISLSLKALQSDPWEKATERYSNGQEIKGTVYNFNPFGALVDFEDGIQGQLHVSEFGSVEEMKKQLELNQSYSFIIEDIKTEEKRIILKLKG